MRLLKGLISKTVFIFQPVIAKQKSNLVWFHRSYSVGTHTFKSVVIIINVELFLIFYFFLFHLPHPLGLFLKYFYLFSVLSFLFSSFPSMLFNSLFLSIFRQFINFFIIFWMIYLLFQTAFAFLSPFDCCLTETAMTI